MTEAVSNFLDAMVAAGIRPVEPIADKLASGEFVRFRADGDKPGRRNGWARLHLDRVAAGAFGHFRLGIQTRWHAGDDLRSLSPAERHAIIVQARAGMARRQAERQAQQEAAAEVAQKLWHSAGKPNPAHLYLVSKGLPPFGVRQRGQALLVPMVDSEFVLRNVQRIFPDSRKLFLSGARTEGLCWLHGAYCQDGSASTGPLVIGEGFATMAAVHHATGHGVVAAMSARNLETVARAMRGLFPAREIVIAADDDSHLSENHGLNAARNAARAIGAHVATPRPETCSAASGTDFADIPRADVAARIADARLGK